jgi:poly-gamma-glutamate synthesis protein (capsule biosynthesis protein)
LKRFIVAILILGVFSFSVVDTGTASHNVQSFFNDNNDRIVTLIFAGDIMGHSPQFQAAYDTQTKTYDYKVCFENVKPYIESADIAVANLEVTLAGPPYSGYPNFSSPDALLDALKYTGYDVMLTANNHVLDRGKHGFERTLKVLSDKEMKFVGSYLNQQQRDTLYPLIIDTHGVKIALLNYTYGTNGYKPTSPTIVNVIDTNLIKKDIKKARSKSADIVVMTVHWGTEYQTKAGIEQQKLAKLFAREGVDLIIGSHPHVVQNAELLEIDSTRKVPVFYSLGNSISNQRNINTDGGIMVKVEIGANSKQILKTTYLPVYVHKGILKKKFQYHLIPTPDFVSDTTANYVINKVDSAALLLFDKNTRERLSNFEIITR